MRDSAYFVKYPSRIEDLWQPHLCEDQNPYEIATTVTLKAIDYGNFITDLRVERQFLEDNANLCSIDGDGIRHCILVRQRGDKDGVLIIPDAGGYVIWAAYLHKFD